jgi:hypothetical protein
MHRASVSAGWFVCVAAIAAVGCGGEGDPGPDGGGTGARCGGFTAQACADGFYCDYPANTCGVADEPGTCRIRPLGCDDNYEPVCGCDGEVHGNACDASAAGVDLNDLGGCTAPLDMFGCGHGFCDVGLSYCQIYGSDVAGVPSDHACVGVPSGCGDAPDCACLADEPCGEVCEADGADVTLICPGG